MNIHHHGIREIDAANPYQHFRKLSINNWTQPVVSPESTLTKLVKDQHGCDSTYLAASTIQADSFARFRSTLHGSVKFIDTLVDCVSGYNDGLDGALDWWIQSAGEQWVGRIDVSQWPSHTWSESIQQCHPRGYIYLYQVVKTSNTDTFSLYWREAWGSPARIHHTEWWAAKDPLGMKVWRKWAALSAAQ
jgi:hypothetical protein